MFWVEHVDGSAESFIVDPFSIVLVYRSNACSNDAACLEELAKQHAERHGSRGHSLMRRGHRLPLAPQMHIREAMRTIEEAYLHARCHMTRSAEGAWQCGVRSSTAAAAKAGAHHWR